MWSNFALVFSFLLVSTFLVYNHRENHQPGPLGRTSSRFIPNVASRDDDFPPLWAGARIELPDNEKFNSNTAKFIAPLSFGSPNGLGFTISVSIGNGQTCGSSTAQFAAGVKLFMGIASFDYSAWSSWGGSTISPPDSLDFTISPGDLIHVTVVVTSETGGNYTVENISNNKVWSSLWKDGGTTLCQRTAEWAVFQLEYPKDPPVTSFGVVAFVNAQATVDDPNSDLMYPSNASYITNMTYRNETFVGAWTGGTTVVVTTDQASLF